MNKDIKTVFSGVQPSGNLTIGNYLGAIKNFSRFSEEYKTFLQESGFVDAKKSAKVINRACTTYHTLFQNVNTGKYESIDHITFMEQTAPKVLYYNTLIADYIIDASDHSPIYIDIKLAK